ncbi:hypothetical protein AB6A40_001482 [Gnathostoma spinigerum]|uniref:Cytochrome P450 n=1 Tax=Gnathostoma spinigerum TaxID=75299 RepID=A0ABD6ED62_9BILA
MVKKKRKFEDTNIEDNEKYRVKRATMIGLLVVFVVAVYFLIVYNRLLIAYIKDRYRFFSLINNLPGVSFRECIVELCKFSADGVEWSYQVEALYRRFAYRHEHGILRFWLGPYPLVFLCRAKSARVIYDSPTQIDKPKLYDAFGMLSPKGPLASNGDDWRLARKITLSAFFSDALFEYINVFNKNCRKLINNLDGFCESGETFDIHPILTNYTISTIIETAMGVSTEQKYTEFVAYNEALQRALKYMFLRIRNPLLWNSTFNWLVGHDEKIKKYCEVCKSLSRKVLQERRQYWEENGGIKPVDEMTKAEKKRLPFIDVLLSMEDKYQLTEEMILSQIDGIIAAGSDSMSNQIGFNLYLLGHRQQYQDKVYHEIRKVLGNSDRDITYADMDNLKYLWQNICETGRIIPNVVLQARKLSEDTEICKFAFSDCFIC